ncbi:MAG: GNAT family N-acetyltransferase [Candidatus Competibacter sp.]
MTPKFADSQHFSDILKLNADSVRFLSPMSLERLEYLHAHAVYHKVVHDGERVLAFLLAFAPGAPYDSVNYRWFAARYADFLYVDRIVVSQVARGQGLASLLYRDLFQTALTQGFSRVVCEFDINPPNPASEAFHRRLGFVQIGTQRVAGGSKEVSLQSAPVQPSCAT